MEYDIKHPYLLRETTYKELENLAITNGRNHEIVLFEKNIDRSDVSEKQKGIQTGTNSWYRTSTTNFRVSDSEIYTFVKKIFYDELTAGTRENLEQIVFDKIYNNKIKIIAGFEASPNGSCLPRIGFDSGVYEKSLKEEGTKVEYTKDDKELEKELKKCKQKNMYTDDKYVLLEDMRITAYTFHFTNISKNIKKIIKKFIREEFTYCIKSNKVIVPEGYIKRGEEGVTEWRQIKQQNNKSNSMEKQILKQTFAEKKAYAHDCIFRTAIVIKTNAFWSKPYITVDGVYSKTRIDKLVCELYDTKNKKQFMEMSDAEILQRAKDYWERDLKQAIRAVDGLMV